MICRIFTACALLAMSGVAAAQSGDVTFRVPLNLTQLSPDISRVRVHCRLQEFASRAISDVSSEIGVSGGEVVTTLSLIFQPSNSGFSGRIGNRVDYSCWLVGFFEPQEEWDEFDPNHQIPAFRLEPRPIPINGQFAL